MKFKRLEIRNIASIKHAVVEFDKDPLKSAQLFLINGPTGSGKSVIFDSICLALFRTAPRLENLGNRSIEDSLEADGILKLSSPVSFVRRGESEASTTLVFEGNNGHIYKACWETELFVKGEKKGAIKGEKQYIIDLTDNSEYRNVKELKELIMSNDVIGLDFERFTRTTMLAQGAFTRFLSANEKEKSEILRKIVGLEYFSLIGKKISEIYTEHKRKLDAQRAALNSITFMDDETREQTKLQLNQTEAALQNARKEHDRLRRFVDYKEKMKRLEEEVSNHRLLWNDALLQVTSDHYFELVTLQGYLDRVKPLFEILNKLSDAEKTKAVLDEESSILARKRMSIKKGLTALAARISSEKKQLEAIEKNLHSYDEYNDVLGRLPVLKESIKQHNLLNQKKGNLENEIQSINQEVLNTELPIKELAVEADLVETELKKAIAEESRLKETYDENEFKRLSEVGGELNEQLKNLNSVLETSRKADEIAGQIKSFEKEVSEQSAVLDKLKKEVDDACQKSNIAQKQLSDFKDVYERAKQSVGDAAIKLRHGLKVGDSCPVCGSQINTDLFDEAFQKAIKPLEDELAQYEKADNDATLKFRELRIKRDTTDTLLKKTIASLALEKNNLETIKNKLKENKTVIDLSIDTDDLTAKLSARISEVDALIAQNREKVKSWGEIQSKVVKASELVANLTGKLINLKQKRSEKITQKEKLQVKLEAKSKELEAIKNELTSLNGQIYEGIPVKLSDFSFDKLVDELDNMIKVKDSLNNQLTQLSESVKSAKTLYDDIEKSMSEVKISDFEGDTPTTREGDLRSEVERLIAGVAVNVSRKNDNVSEINQLKAEESNFYLSNTDFSPQFCQTLAAIPDSIVNSICEEIYSIQNKARENYKQYETALRMYKNQRDVESESLSELSVEEAVVKITQLSSELDDMSISIGAFKQQIATDDENKKRFVSQRETIEKLESDVSLWAEVNDDFGGQNGERFSRVACTYALNNLIERSNYYLSRFSPRYVLSPNIGSLEISIYDNLSGYTRAFNTLSGGESFVISLSLALALSSIQDVRFVPDTIFIDEGFGTLSADYLDRVMMTLEQLQMIEGRRVALISHVDVLRDRIPVKITVTPTGNSSLIDVVAE